MILCDNLFRRVDNKVTEGVAMNRINEKTYKSIRKTGVFNLVFGIILIIGGVTIGTLSIVNVSKLLANKNLRNLL